MIIDWSFEESARGEALESEESMLDVEWEEVVLVIKGSLILI